MMKSPHFYLVIVCLIAAYFSPWFIIPACVIWTIPFFEPLINKEPKSLSKMQDRLNKLEREFGSWKR